MRNLILIAITLLLTYSCSKDDNNDLVLKRGKASFKLNNVEKTFTKQNSFNSGVLGLGDQTIERISLFFPKPTETTEFPITFNMDKKGIITAAYIINEKTYRATNGVNGIGKKGNIEITVTSYKNSKISGTFKLTLVNKDDSSDSVVITEGVFKDIPSLFSSILTH